MHNYNYYIDENYVLLLVEKDKYYDDNSLTTIERQRLKK